MKKLAPAGLAMVMGLVFAPVTTATPDRQDAPSARPAVDVRTRFPGAREWVTGEIVVERRAGASAQRLGRLHAAVGATVVKRLPFFDVDLVRLRGDAGVLETIRRYEADPSVAHAEPNFLRYPLEIPNDPSFPQLWGLNNTGQSHEVADPPPASASGKADSDIDGVQAWNSETGDPETVVAVLDSGADLDHPDLDDNLWTNPGEAGGAAGVDDDNNGFVDDVNGYDFRDEDPVPEDSDPSENGHGTHIFGTIAAEGNNTDGVVGVCRECSVMVVRFGLTLADELEALRYARREGADIVNGSYGGPSFSLIERSAFEKTGRAGVLSVIAAGNANLDNDLFLARDSNGDGAGDDFSPLYPASYSLPSILSVAATNHRDRYAYGTGCATRNPRFRCAFTSWGRNSVDVAAPGVDIFSTAPVAVDPRRYTTLDGTSFAAPHVAGVAGLIKSKFPAYSLKDLKNAIMNGADRRGSLDRLEAFSGGADRGRFTRTNGRLNANVSLEGDRSGATRSNDGNIKGAKRIRTKRAGKVEWPGDSNDVATKLLHKGRRYKAVLDGPRGEQLDLVVYKPKTKEIWQIKPKCFSPSFRVPCDNLVRYEFSRGADESTRFTAKRKGSYYFQVSAGVRSAGRYELRVRRSGG